MKILYSSIAICGVIGVASATITTQLDADIAPRHLQDCATSLMLWDATKDEPIKAIEDGDEIDMCLAESFNIEVVAPCIGEEGLWMTDQTIGKFSSVDLERPFFYGRDVDGDVLPYAPLSIPGTKSFRYNKVGTRNFKFFTVTFIACPTDPDPETDPTPFLPPGECDPSRSKVSLELWDATTDVRLGELKNGDEIDLCLAETFSIEVINPCAEKVSFWLKKADETHLRDAHDEMAPFMLGGDDGVSDVFAVPELSVPGGYILVFESETGERVTLDFTVVECVCEEEVSLQLWDATTDVRLGEFVDGDVIDLCRATTFTIEVINNCAEKISFWLKKGDETHLRDAHDDMAPFTLGGDNGAGDVFAVPELNEPGEYILIVKSPSGERVNYNFEVVECICEETVSLRLWDATKDVRLGKFGDGDVIDLCLAETFTIEVVNNCAEKISFWLKKADETHLRDAHDDMAPFTLGGDDGAGDVFAVPELNVPGGYILVVKSPTGERLTYNFQVSEEEKIDLFLWDAKADARLSKLPMTGGIIDQCLTDKFSIQAVSSCDIKKQKFLLKDGVTKEPLFSTIDYTAPFFLKKDKMGDVFPVPELSVPGKKILAITKAAGGVLTYRFTSKTCRPCMEDVDLFLWDANTDTRLSKLPMTGGIIDQCLTDKFSIQAINTCKVEKQKFILKDATTKEIILSSIDYTAPFFLKKDKQGDVFPAPQLSTVGDYILNIPLSTGTIQRYTFSSVACDACDEPIKLFLWDATNDKKLKELPDGAVFSQCLAKSFSIKVVNPCAKSQVAMWLKDRDGNALRETLDKAKPFFLGKNKGADVLPVAELNIAGLYTLIVKKNNGEDVSFTFKSKVCKA